MFALEAFKHLFAAERFFAHCIVAFWTFFVNRFEIGDEFTFWIVGASKKLTPFAISFLKRSTTLRAGGTECFGRSERFGIFAFRICRACQKFASFAAFDDHRCTAFVTYLLCLFLLFWFVSICIFCIFAFWEVTASDKFTIISFAKQQFASAFRAYFSCGDRCFEAFDICFACLYLLQKGSIEIGKHFANPLCPHQSYQVYLPFWM